MGTIEESVTPTFPPGATKQPRTRGKSRVRLTRHPKPRSRDIRYMSTAQRIQELMETPGRNARESIVNLRLEFHDMFPSPESAKSIAATLETFEQEEIIESNDPTSFEDALARVRQDVDSLFVDLAGDDIQAHFFSELPNTERNGRPGLDEIEAQWMHRWITSPDGRKRTADEVSKLVGFAGEYLVVNLPYVG